MFIDAYCEDPTAPEKAKLTAVLAKQVVKEAQSRADKQLACEKFLSL